MISANLAFISWNSIIEVGHNLPLSRERNAPELMEISRMLQHTGSRATGGSSVMRWRLMFIIREQSRYNLHATKSFADPLKSYTESHRKLSYRKLEYLKHFMKKDVLLLLQTCNESMAQYIESFSTPATLCPEWPASKITNSRGFSIL